MNTSVTNSLRGLAMGALMAALQPAVGVCADRYTKVKPYAVAVTADYVLQPLLSVADQVPNTSDPARRYQMIGIPDGLGATKGPGNTTILYVNHELGSSVLSEPNVGGVRNRAILSPRAAARTMSLGAPTWWSSTSRTFLERPRSP
jgi:hypothetical protein